MDNDEIIKGQQRIDRQVFGKTNLNDDGAIKMSTNDVVDELQEINAGVGELTTLVVDIKEIVVDIKEKLDVTKDTDDDCMSEELQELKQEMSKQTLYLGQLQTVIYGRVTVFLFFIVIVLILILVKLH